MLFVVEMMSFRGMMGREVCVLCLYFFSCWFRLDSGMGWFITCHHLDVGEGRACEEGLS